VAVAGDDTAAAAEAGADALVAVWAPATAAVTRLVTVFTALVAALTADPAGSLPEPARGVLAWPPVAALVAAVTALVTAVPPGSWPVGADNEAGAAGGGSSLVAAWACRDKRNRRKKIPAATIATRTARRAMRRDTSCVIVSSPHREDAPAAPRCDEGS
jgi:hypothetical protein